MKFYKFSIFDNNYYKSDYKFIKGLLFDVFKREELTLNDIKEKLHNLIRSLDVPGKQGLLQTSLAMFYGAVWEKNRKPFYRLYPGVIDALKDIKLSKTFCFERDAKPIDSLIIEFPVDYPLMFKDLVIGCLQYACYYKGKDKMIYLLLQDKNGDILCQAECSANIFDMSTMLRNEQNVEWLAEGLDINKPNTVDPSLLFFPGFATVIDILGGVLMLEKSPELFEPVVLNRDVEKYKNADEKRKAFIVERAKRNGINGFDVGRILKTKEEMKKMREENNEATKKGKKAPHIRISHLHTFWTGEGKTTPIIKLLNTILVNKDNMFNVPQDYYGK